LKRLWMEEVRKKMLENNINKKDEKLSSRQE
jgi:hypothetical protein